MEPTTITSKGQVTIPKQLRQQMGIRAGSISRVIALVPAWHHSMIENLPGESSAWAWRLQERGGMRCAYSILRRFVAMGEIRRPAMG